MEPKYKKGDKVITTVPIVAKCIPAGTTGTVTQVSTACNGGVFYSVDLERFGVWHNIAEYCLRS